ncbi:MAG: LacI family DNA-binding transcriptional regulator [Victivallaceae bacterium]|nr:LacI family DNA-binding transcriptional regulator [Victivallaceae bacterium]
MISSLELAELCGVSQGTVDRALHNRDGISRKTKQKILETAEKYGYRPNPATRELLTGKSCIVGAIVPHLNGIFYMDLLAVIKQEIAREGFKLMISQYDSRRELFDLLSDFSARRFGGAIVIPPGDNTEIPDTFSLKMKIIALLSPVTGKNTRFISPDEERTGIDAVNFLLKRGRRRIIHFTYDHPDYWAVRLRMAGYRKAMRENGLEPVIILNKPENNFQEIIRRCQPEAIFCHNDWLAMTALEQLRAAGVKVPEQVAVLGVDSSPTFNALFSDLTTMEYPREWIAAETLKVLSGKGKPTDPPYMAVIPRKT